MTSSSPSHVVVIGAGWAGWGAAKALCEAGVRVTLVDGMADPTGRQPVTTASGKPFEAGTRGFWKDYPNINALTDELGLDGIFTDFTSSAFWSPDGLEATAPVFGASPQWPSPLGQMVATIEHFKRLPIQDRLTIAGLLYAMLDLYRSEEVFEDYDALTAQSLFTRLGISERLINDFLRPTLLVGLFKPPEELSAAVTMELLYYYALAHQDSFDVRWIRSKSIAEHLFQPLSQRLIAQHQLRVLGGTLVTRLNVSPATKAITSVELKNTTTNEVESLDDVDAVVLAVGAKGLRSLLAESPDCSAAVPELSAAASLGSIDVVSTRLWLDRYVPVAHPANVFSRFESLEGAGGTFFMLDQLQKGWERELWGGDEPQGSVIASDFYNTTTIATLSDEAIIDRLMHNLLPTAHPDFRAARVLDSEVRRYPGSVSLFSPGSFHKRPPLESSAETIVCAGDWVRMGEREHGAKGLCQERAYVCGLEAANSLIRRGIVSGTGTTVSAQHAVIPIRPDEPQVILGRALNKLVMDPIEALGLKLPWLDD
ncbi:zeta-carotene desaturase [Synechococcus sp. RSCCF101]|uniref:hydroxysqualene dehydroxylase n=1 Tax=Synechococcus sp. RSCCF101 TaxID=2511069 RepID=UPI001245FF36|nr:FAD-dependent oxidoreductase [Synechococcus sp. RSCCF101]QEY33056.1 zeta-carotene desaturase [Synechococcus sp. RSCCF101]